MYLHLVEEDDARLLGPRQLEQLAHHARALAHVLLHQLRADHLAEHNIYYNAMLFSGLAEHTIFVFLHYIVR